jgi:hypothetical protein
MKQTITAIVVILVVIWVASDPAHAGDSVHTWLNDAVTFLRHLAGQA